MGIHPDATIIPIEGETFGYHIWYPTVGTIYIPGVPPGAKAAPEDFFHHHINLFYKVLEAGLVMLVSDTRGLAGRNYDRIKRVALREDTNILTQWQLPERYFERTKGMGRNELPWIKLSFPRTFDWS